MEGTRYNISFKPVSPNQIDSIISAMNASASFGLDEIDARMIKLGKQQLLPVITHIVNLSVSSRTFPEHWKCAKIIPLHKKDDRSNPKNYRPVALLPVVSKILERAVFVQFIDYLESNKLMNPSETLAFH